MMSTLTHFGPRILAKSKWQDERWIDGWMDERVVDGWLDRRTDSRR